MYSCPQSTGGLILYTILANMKMRDKISQKQKSDLGGSRPVQVGDVYEIPVEGSLGLLALGATGLKLWRGKRAQANKKADKKK